MQAELLGLYAEMEFPEDVEDKIAALQLKATLPRSQTMRAVLDSELRYAKPHKSGHGPVEDLAVMLTQPKRRQANTNITRRYT